MLLSSCPKNPPRTLELLHKAIADLTELSYVVEQLPADLIHDDAKLEIVKCLVALSDDLTNAI